MNITYVVAIDLTPAVDESGYLDERQAVQIVYNCGGFPAGATVRLHIGHCRFGGEMRQIIETLSSAGGVELTGFNAGGLKRIGHILKGGDPLDRLVG